MLEGLGEVQGPGEFLLRHSGKTTPLFAQAIDWPHLDLI
jgi:hypothetical protein